MIYSYLLQRKHFYRNVFTSIQLLFLGIAVIIFAFVNLIVGLHNMSGWDDVLNLLRICGTAALLATGVFTLFLLVEIADGFYRQQLRWNWQYARYGMGVLALLIFLASCSAGIVRKGIKKDLTTGMQTTYSQLEPANMFVRMNNETIHHTDIPLGERFDVVNEHIEGFTLKNGKARVGCSLRITDAKDSVLLEAKDLFEGKDEYTPEKASTLSCTVSTGEPMKWEEYYYVTVLFWDKQGEGRIENKLKIRAIDIP